MRSLFIFLLATALVYGIDSPMSYAAEGYIFGGRVTGENDGQFLPAEYYSELTVDGKSLNLLPLQTKGRVFLNNDILAMLKHIDILYYVINLNRLRATSI